MTVRSILDTKGHDILSVEPDSKLSAAVKMLSLLKYVDGDLTDHATYEAMSAAIGSPDARVLYYLEVPPFLFGRVIKGLTSETASSVGLNDRGVMPTDIHIGQHDVVVVQPPDLGHPRHERMAHPGGVHQVGDDRDRRAAR